MFEYNLSDTIAALATALGESGIGIVRISGKDALTVADKIFLSKNKKKPSNFKTYTTHYGWIVNRLTGCRVNRLGGQNRQTGKPANRQTEIIDEVILTVMRAPKSYTKEDVVEINCHGGIIALRRVLDLVLINGCRMASPGEFTQRAFLNGRIDLAQAEAVLDIIRAKTDSALKLGLEQLKGALSGQINQIRQALIEILSILEANIDFPQEEIDTEDPKKMRQNLAGLSKKIISLLESAKYGRVFREGVNVVICGKPNVGKSSLLNALLRQERSIVTPVAGTTRDTIEEIIDIKGIPIRIVDTAGIIEPRDLVEKKAVERSKKFIASADLAILLFDGNKKLGKEDLMLIKKLIKKNVIALINKIDLPQKIEKKKILQKFNSVIEISAKKAKNIHLLEEAIANLFYNGKMRPAESILVSNHRHIAALGKTEKLIAQAIGSLDNRLSSEFIAQDLKDALFSLESISGQNFSEDLLNKIFSEFCIGK